MTRARELADLSTPKAFTVDDNYNIGINSTSPDAKLDVVGVVSATTYYGDGSNLDNVTSTTINNNADNRLITGSDTANTLNGESTCTYDGATFVTPAATVGSNVTVNATGLNVSGVVTATSFSGSGEGLTGVASTDYIITGTAATFANTVQVTDTTASSSTATGAVIISGGVGIAKDLYVGGEVSIAGTVTYEDVTQIDSVGIITAQKDVRVGRNFNVAGVSTFSGSIGNVTVGIITGATAIGNASGNTVYYGDGSGLTGIAAGVSTEDNTQSSGLVTIDLSKDDHKFTASGICTVSCTGSGTEGGSGTLRITNSGITTVGFSTYFLWPSGSAPVLTTADGAINLISYTIQRNGSTGIGTQLLAGASLNFS